MSKENLQNGPLLPRDPSTTLPPHALEQLRFDILARLSIPDSYPEDPLNPILIPFKMDLDGFLEQSTGVCACSALFLRRLLMLLIDFAEYQETASLIDIKTICYLLKAHIVN